MQFRCASIVLLVGIALLVGSLAAQAQPAADHHQHFFSPETVERSPKYLR
jgi:hypothetical protein